MRLPFLALAAVFGAASMQGCGKSKCSSGDTCSSTTDAGPDAFDANQGCQPLLGYPDAGGDCLLPFPSDFFRVPDSNTATGFKLDTYAARPIANKPLNTDPNFQKEVDGSSEVPLITTVFPEAVSPDGFAHILDDPTASTTASVHVLIINAATGALVPHFVDLDPHATDPNRQALVIHPIQALTAGQRYVVAIHGVTALSGGLVSAPEGFRELRDSQAAGDARVGPLASHYESDIFPLITAAGVSRGDLQMAWDFTVGSDAYRQSDMLQVRALTLAWLAQNTPAVTIDATGSYSACKTLPSDAWQCISGTVTGPMFLVAEAPESALNRDASGHVAQNGTVTFPFIANVPTRVRDAFDPGLALAYGHGFFGSRDEVTYGSTRNVADHLSAVMFGIDWWGMDFDDGARVAANLSDHPYLALDFADRVHQGMANWMVMTAAIRGPLRTNPAFLRPMSGPGQSTNASGASNGGQCFYGTDVSYLGISQGHILGSTMTALNPDFHRIVLMMGGVGFGQLISRAAPFAQDFEPFISLSMPDPLEQQKFEALMQTQFDRFDPATYADFLVTHPLSGTPADRRVMMENGLGDDEVPNLGTFLQARMTGIPLAMPSPTDVYGVGHASMPVSGSAFVLYDFGIDLHHEYDLAEVSSVENGVHEALRESAPALSQMAEFYGSGTIASFCDGGVCDLPCPAPADAGICTRP